MTRVTINHDEIKTWAQQHQGKPQKIDYPQAKGDMPGIRIDLPGHEDDALLAEHYDISWDEFFNIFEDEQLAFIYDNEEFPDTQGYSYRFIERMEVPDSNEETKNQKHSSQTKNNSDLGGAGRFSTYDLPPTVGNGTDMTLEDKIKNAST